MGLFTQKSLESLQKLSPLHVLVISNADLPIIEHMHGRDPSSLTNDVIRDAFVARASATVLRFLVDADGLGKEETSRLIGDALLDAIPVLQGSSHSQERKTKTLRWLRSLATVFPELLLEEVEDYQCSPVTILLMSTCFPQGLVRYMAEQAKPSKSNWTYRLHGSIYWDDRLWRVPFRQQSRGMFDAQWMEIIGIVWAKIPRISINIWNVFTTKNIAQFLDSASKSQETKELTIKLSPQQPFDLGFADLIKPATLERFEHSNIERVELILGSLLDDDDDVVGISSCSQSIVPLLLHLKQLRHVTIEVLRTNVMMQTVPETLIKLLKNGGKLESLSLIGNPSSKQQLLPVIRAANSCPTLSKLDIQGLDSLQQTAVYQSFLLDSLESNTYLTEALIDDDVCWRWDYQTKKKKQFITGDPNDKQRQIDYLTLLNKVGRGKARDTKAMSKQTLVDLLSPETVKGKLTDLRMKVEKRGLLCYNMQYGLLREAPSLWTAQTSSGRKRKRKSSRKPKRRRKLS